MNKKLLYVIAGLSTLFAAIVNLLVHENKTLGIILLGNASIFFALYAREDGNKKSK